MATYEIKLANGSVYEVDGADGASEDDLMGAVAAQLTPDDLTVARTKNDAFGAFLRKQAMEPREGESEDDRFKRLYGGGEKRDPIGMGEGLARSALQSMTFGSGDELVAGAAAGVKALQGEDFGENYQGFLDRERGRLKQFRDEQPVSALATEIAAGIPTAVALAPALGAASLTGKVLQGGAIGAGEGALYGFLSGEGGAQERAKEAAKTAAITGPIGMAAPAVGAGVKNITKKLMEGSAAKSAGMPKPAFNILRRTLDADDSLRAGQKVAPDGMLADVGHNARALLDTAVQKSGPAGTKALKAVEDRATQASKKMTDALDSTLGSPSGVKKLAKGIAQGTHAARKEAYDLAYSKPIDYASDAGRNIEGVLSRIPKRILGEAITEANEEMQIAGIKNQQIMAQIADDGTVSFKEMPNVLQLDFVKKALGRKGAESIDSLGRATHEGSNLTNLARELKNAVGDAVPEYLKAVKVGGDKIQRDNALRLGRDLLKSNVTRETVADMASDLSDEARDAAKKGLRSFIDDTLANVKRTVQDGNTDAREAVKLLKDLSSKANREKVSMILGDEADALFKQIDDTAAALDLRAAIAQNSKTFVRTATNDEVQSQVRDGVVNAARGGEPVNVLKRMVQAIGGRTPDDVQRISDDTYSALVDALTGPRGKDAQALIQQLNTAQGRIGPEAERWRQIAQQLVGANTAATAPASQRF